MVATEANTDATLATAAVFHHQRWMGRRMVWMVEVLVVMMVAIVVVVGVAAALVMM